MPSTNNGHAGARDAVLRAGVEMGSINPTTTNDAMRTSQTLAQDVLSPCAVSLASLDVF